MPSRFGSAFLLRELATNKQDGRSKRSVEGGTCVPENWLCVLFRIPERGIQFEGVSYLDKERKECIIIACLSLG